MEISIEALGMHLIKYQIRAFKHPKYVNVTYISTKKHAVTNYEPQSIDTVMDLKINISNGMRSRSLALD